MLEQQFCSRMRYAESNEARGNAPLSDGARIASGFMFSVLFLAFVTSLAKAISVDRRMITFSRYLDFLAPLSLSGMAALLICDLGSP